jgi:very-short-patch-repair endonuclease
VEYDRERTNWLEEQGYRVLRFWNNAVLTETDAVVVSIAHALDAAP